MYMYDVIVLIRELELIICVYHFYQISQFGLFLLLLFSFPLILHSHKHFHFCNSIHANILSLLNDTPTYSFNHLFKSTWSTDKRHRRNYLYLGYDVFPYTRDIKPRCLPLIFIAYDFCLIWHQYNFIWENLIGKI